MNIATERVPMRLFNEEVYRVPLTGTLEHWTVIQFQIIQRAT